MLPNRLGILAPIVRSRLINLEQRFGGPRLLSQTVLLVEFRGNVNAQRFWRSVARQTHSVRTVSERPPPVYVWFYEQPALSRFLLRTTAMLGRRQPELACCLLKSSLP